MHNNQLKIFNRELWAVCEAAHGADNISILCSVYALMVNISASEKEIEIGEWCREKASLFSKLSLTFEHVAKDVYKNNTSLKEKSDEDVLWTIPEITHIYNISSQAIRQACNERRLVYEKGNGKCKYLIKKSEMDRYFKSAKGKSK